ncbi:MAG: hypothetical protein ACKOBW_14220 [Planctomycetota bacterium]
MATRCLNSLMALIWYGFLSQLLVGGVSGLPAQELPDGNQAAIYRPSVILASRSPKSLKLKVLVETPREAGATAGEEQTAWEGTLRPGAVQAIAGVTTGVVVVEVNGKTTIHQLQGRRAYVLRPAKQGGAIELVELAFGNVPELNREALEKVVRAPSAALAAGKLPVLLCMDSREPDKQKLWEPRLRARLQAATTHFKAVTGIELEVVEVRSWTPNRVTQDINLGRKDFQQSVELGEAQLAIGFSRQFSVTPEEYPRAATPPALLATHLLIPEVNVGVSSEQCSAMLLHDLGRSWGAVLVPESNSPLRPDLAEPARPWPLAYDPANALIMSIVAGEVRSRGVRELKELSAPNLEYVTAIHRRLDAALNQAMQDKLVAGRDPVNPVNPVIDQPLPPLAGAPLPRPAPPGRPDAGLPGMPAATGVRPAAPNFEPLPSGNQFTVTEIKLPDVPGGDSIRTGTTLDRQGRVWFAISSSNQEVGSAQLMVHDSEKGETRSLGSVADWLQKTRRYREGELSGQIVTPLVAAADGKIYFASLGEDLPRPNPERRPPWGSRLWRLDPQSGDWEHLAVVPDGVVSLAVRGDALFALAYPGHVVYQLQLTTGELKKQDIGSLAGHCCRTLLVDQRGHAFVPRVQNLAGKSVELIELSESLEPLATTSIEYFGTGPTPDLTGVIGSWEQGDGTVAFLTAAGALYRIRERLAQNEPTIVELVSRQPAQAAANLLTATAQVNSDLIFLAQQSSGAATERLQLVMTTLPQTARFGSAFPGLANFPGMVVQGTAGWSTKGEIYLAGTYPRGTLEVSPTLVEKLRQSGWDAERIGRLKENARRLSQPVLFKVGLPAGAE